MQSTGQKTAARNGNGDVNPLSDPELNRLQELAGQASYKESAINDQIANRCSDLLERCRKHKVRIYDLPGRLQKIAVEQRVSEMMVTAHVPIRLETYGLLCSAAYVHGTKDWQEMLGIWVDSNIHEWSGDRYFMVDEIDLPEVQL